MVRIEVDGGTFEVVASDFAGPGALKFDHQGRLHVLDALHGEIVRFSQNFGESTIIARLTSGLDNLAFDSEGRLFVSSFTDNFIGELVQEDSCAADGFCGEGLSR